MSTRNSSAIASTDLPGELRRHRQKLRISQNQLALRLGVTQQSVARWEKGLPPRSNMVPIIESELESSRVDPLETDALAKVINLPGTIATVTSTPNRSGVLDEFLLGCAAMMKRGDYVSEEVVTGIARILGIIGANSDEDQ